MPEIVCYRAAAYRTPTRVRPHDRPGRYHRLDSPPTQYFALHPFGPWAETIRNRGYTEPDDALALRLPVWDVRLVVPEDPVRVDFEAAAGGTTPAPIAADELIADDQLRCREFADAVRADRSAPRVLRVPSAALPGAENIVVLGPRRTIEYLRRPRREQQVPAAVGAVAARALESMLSLIRHRGQPHAYYEAWAAGEEYQLPELDPIGLAP
jgi:hypothetical protein